jgi:membrane-bound lytic murein transglycosylase D
LNHYLRTIAVLLFVAVLLVPACAQNVFTPTFSEATCIDPLICQLDSMSLNLLSRDKFFVNGDALQASINEPYNQIPRYTDAQIMEKMKLIPSMVQLNYNTSVKQFIEFFAYKRRGFMSQCLANSQIYFPIFEEVLDKNGLPLELKYLSVIESALNPIAISRAGAAGLWQMMYSTGTLMGLNCNSYIDERRDPVKATEAAAKYMKGLYDMYGDWQLVLAAYNSGPGTVNKAIARAGGVKNFWAILPYLPAETRSYVPTYIAAVYVMEHYKDFDLVSAEPRRELYALDTVKITAKVSLKHISEVLNMPADELQFLNPSVRAGVIPYTEAGFPLNLPVNYFATFEARKLEIMNDSSQMVQNFEPLAYAPRVIWYKVKSNRETINTVAAQYGVSASSIKKWNYMKSTAIYAGEKIKIILPAQHPETTAYTQAFTSRLSDKNLRTAAVDTTVVNVQVASPENGGEAVADTVQDTTAKGKTTATTGTTTNASASTTDTSIIKINNQCGCIYHVVQAGDTLWNIAQRYQGVTVDKLKADNSNLLNRPLRVGDVLKIFM